MKVKQTIPPERRFTIEQFNRMFPDNNACLDWLMSQRYPGYMAECAYCKTERKFHRVTTRKVYSCDYCGTMIAPMAGTIFEKSTTSLRLWFYAMYIMSATRCGISAKQIQREVGVTYKTAWRMFKQIRTLMSENISLEGSLIEMDETYVGGRRRGGRPGRASGPAKEKAIVIGAVERGGKVIALVSDDVKKATLHGIAKEYILPDSIIYTDHYPAYMGLDKINGYQHRRINHSAGVYVVGDTHTQTIEGFWSLVKRGIGGVYHSVSKKYLQTYLDEYTFRYSRRIANQPMFTSLLSQVVGKAE
ncbi:MAG: IS1595 family transposase [Silvibacterium sp.]